MHVKISEVFHYLGKATLGHLVHPDRILKLLTLTLQMEVARSSKHCQHNVLLHGANNQKCN
jgi:hypothetical protein